jgi:hypothetical protein
VTRGTFVGAGIASGATLKSTDLSGLPGGNSLDARLLFRDVSNVGHKSEGDEAMKMRTRINAAEVAAVLRQHPAVIGSTVVIRTDSLGGKVLIGYVTMNPTDRTTHGDLRRHLRERLPGVELPIMFARLDALPPLCAVSRRAA